MDIIQKSVVIASLTIIPLFLLVLQNHVFAIDFPKSLIIPVKGEFKDSNQAKLNYCAQSYMLLVPKIYQDDEDQWDGAIIACAYGMYNYNVNIGDTYKVNRFDRQMIEIETEKCMLDNHCMNKINQIIKGKIALKSGISIPKESQKNIPKKVSPEQEEQRLIRFCAQYYYAIDRPQDCENLKPEVKQKIELEAKEIQKRGY
jgi:hypothetical protein